MRTPSLLVWLPALILLLALPVRADLPLAVEVSVAGGNRVAVPGEGPGDLLVPLEVKVTTLRGEPLGEGVLVLDAFEANRVRRGDRPGFDYYPVHGSLFRVENLSPKEFTMEGRDFETLRLALHVPCAVALDTYYFRARVSASRGETKSEVLAIEITRGEPDVDLAPVAVTKSEVRDLPGAPHALALRIQFANLGSHSWAEPSASALVVVQGEGDERVERTVSVGVVPGGTRVAVEVELPIELPRQVEVVVDPPSDAFPHGVFPERDETNNRLEVALPGGR
ncbi:MAG: hypothetical protein HY720_33205 [Planctomycetes bacterium]|nr:hypothetical protein [Planctomycetota bacterium]